jgi:hypothetical protein
LSIVGADQRGHAAGLRQQVPNPAKIVHALMAQQRVQIRGRQAGPGKFTILYLARASATATTGRGIALLGMQAQ